MNSSVYGYKLKNGDTIIGLSSEDNLMVVENPYIIVEINDDFTNISITPLTTHIGNSEWTSFTIDSNQLLINPFIVSDCLINLYFNTIEYDLTITKAIIEKRTNNIVKSMKSHIFNYNQTKNLSPEQFGYIYLLSNMEPGTIH
jgi:hypothetical protein